MAKLWSKIERFRHPLPSRYGTMSERFVTLIDGDGTLSAHLTEQLCAYGLRVEAVGDANDLMARKEDLPQLIVLCFDPKRTGWAVCNRLRKSPTLKAVPLIIT